jgi:hypothetical protein
MNLWNKQVVDYRNLGKPSQGATLSWGREGGSKALPHGRGGSLFRARDGDGPIREVLESIAAQVCMNVIW